MRRPWCISAVVSLALVGMTMTGCRSVGGGPDDGGERVVGWDLAAVEILDWTSSDPAFDQGRAMEASGLVGFGRTLFATSEKYARLIRIDAESLEVEISLLDVPKHSELEGVTILRDEILFCDEASGGIWASPMGSADGDGHKSASGVPMVGLEVAAGKIGLEGIAAVGGASDRVYVLLERTESDSGVCSSEIFPMLYEDGRLFADAKTLHIPLEDCNWRLTGLEWWQGKLYALKTRFPGEEYEIVTVDPESGLLTGVLQLTELLVTLGEKGWHNNVEGIAVTSDGAMWLISDNAMTGTVDDFTPPAAEKKTLLMKIPPLMGN